MVGWGEDRIDQEFPSIYDASKLSQSLLKMQDLNAEHVFLSLSYLEHDPRISSFLSSLLSFLSGNPSFFTSSRYLQVKVFY